MASNFYPDTTSYPLTYRMSMGWRLSMLAIAFIAVAAGLAMLHFFLSGRDKVLLAAGLPSLLAGLCLLFATLRYKVVLYRDAIEIHNLFSVKRLLCKQLRGRRQVPVGNGPPMIQLWPLDQKQRNLNIHGVLRTDAAFQEWMDNITDLDALDRQQTLDEIAADSNLGTTERERTDRLEARQQIAKVANVAGAVATVWAIAYPQPYGLLMMTLLAMPWLALLLMRSANGLYQVEGRKGDVRPHLAMPILMPGLGLLLRVLADFEMVHPKPAILLGLLCSLVMTSLFAYHDRIIRGKPLMVVVLAAAMTAYGFGAAGTINGYFDRAPTDIFQTQVTGKHASHGKSSSYYLQLAPWGPVDSAEDATVSRAMYDTTPTGSQVCVVLHKGLLRMPWYVVRHCAE